MMGASDEEVGIAHGYLMAVAELVRRFGATEIARDMLVGIGLDRAGVVRAGIEPHDKRELLKAFAPQLKIVARGVA